MCFAFALPPEKSHITPGGNLPPVWEPLSLIEVVVVVLLAIAWLAVVKLTIVVMTFSRLP